MDLNKKQMHCLLMGRRIVDQFYLDEDFNVPDAKDDVLKIIYGKAEIHIDDVKTVESYLRVSGRLYFHVLYSPSRMEPRLDMLEGNFPFEEMVYLDGETGGNYFVSSSRVEFMPSLVHSRKLGIRAMVELEINCEDIKDEEIKHLELSQKDLEARYTDLKMARTLSLYDKDIKDTKQRLTSLVREIDRCIALLNE